MLPESPSGPKVDSIAGNKPIAKNVAAEISNKINIPNFEKGIIGEKNHDKRANCSCEKSPYHGYSHFRQSLCCSLVSLW